MVPCIVGCLRYIYSVSTVIWPLFRTQNLRFLVFYFMWLKDLQVWGLCVQFDWDKFTGILIRVGSYKSMLQVLLACSWLLYSYRTSIIPWLNKYYFWSCIHHEVLKYFIYFLTIWVFQFMIIVRLDWFNSWAFLNR